MINPHYVYNHQGANGSGVLLLCVNEEMTGGSLFRRAKKAICRGGSSRGGSSRGESSRETESITPSITPSTPVHPDSQEEIECSGSQQTSRHSFCGTDPAPEEGVWLIDEQGPIILIHACSFILNHVDEQGNPIRRRGRTTCADIQNMPPGTRIHIEVNENNIPCNIPESILLGSYLGVVARDPMLAPIAFPDWRNKGMEPFKKKMLAEVESKFEFPGHIRHWILQSLGVKLRNYKTTLKAEHWDSRPIEEILETVPAGVDQTQWCQLVNQWSKPEDQERAAKNSANANKQTCPHTMGRVSSVRRQKETSIKDRLQLWKINRMHKDGTWSSEDAMQRWTQACKLLAEEGLTPEDDNIEANERVFAIVMGPEHSGRVRTQGFGVTPTRFFPQSKTEGGSGSNFGQIASLREEFRSFQDNQKREFGLFRDEMRQFMQGFQMNHPPHEGSEMV
ncbi:hypothetical protein IEQ34_003038 [Dendrobium chrysotoxum]|uniref:Uncharacterized protein n=1 Tax=Dendrobium chrysotoxum TaxID=161865 RepID=A0AAV7HKZ5_DENCH|nr:hypothetical protein IEQ34_003038 [Dendrobium chrysotoxum]